MRNINLVLVQIFVLAVASPFPQDLMFGDEPQDLGDLSYAEPLADPVYGGDMQDTSDIFSSSPSPSSNELVSFDQSSYPAENNDDDSLESWDQGELDSDCFSDQTIGYGKIRLRRSCLQSKWQTSKSIVCPKPASQLACCANMGVGGTGGLEEMFAGAFEGVFDSGCKACRRSLLFGGFLLFLAPSFPLNH